MSELDEIAASLLPRAQAGGLASWPVDRLRAWVKSWLAPDETPQVIDGVLESLRGQLGA
jgi:hypothetical protein